ncbi:MAG TPA: hypothetical protein VMW01_16530 [Williamwhitmania sp.]|nr:hypothetical protein [Williamwhitmania sp.]
MLQIAINNSNLDLLPDTAISVSLTSPIFNDKGSSSLPFKVSRSKRNMLRLQHPDRITGKTIGSVNFPTTIKSGTIKLSGNSEITDLDATSVEMALKINEGAFWEWAKNTPMNELSFPDETFTGTVYDKTGAWFARVSESVDKVWPNEYFTCFPVIISRSTDAAGQVNFRILNAPNLNNGEFWQRNESTVIGLTDFSPFLYLNAAISLIFQSYGIRVSYNFLDTIDEFNRMAIINNATMPIRDGYLHWNELLPSDSVSNFISWIEGKFPVHFSVDMNKREAQILSIEDICLKFDPITVNGKLDVITDDARPLSMTSDHLSSQYAKPAQYSQAFIEGLPFSYVNTGIYYPERTIYLDDRSVPDRVNYPDKIILVLSMNCYFFMHWVQNDDKTAWQYISTLVGSRDYDITSTEDNAKKIETSLCVPAMDHPTLRGNLIVGGVSFDGTVETLMLPSYEEKLKDFADDFFGLNAYNDSVNFTPALCTYRGKHGLFVNYVDGGVNKTLTSHIAWGSPFLYDSYNLRFNNPAPNTHQLFDDKISLQLVGDDGLYERFWKFYANIYISSAKPVSVTSGLQNFKNPRFDRLYRIDGNNVLLNEVKQTHTNSKVTVDEVTAYTVKHYE